MDKNQSVGSPRIRDMLSWVEHGSGVLVDSYYRKPLAVWTDRTRIVVNKGAPEAARKHVLAFLRLYEKEKVIGVTEAAESRFNQLL